MIEVEIQKLTAAIEALTKALLNPPKFAVALEAVENTQQGNETLAQIDKGIINSDRINREDDAVREAMQAERLAKLDKIEREQAEHAKTMDEVYGKTLAEKKAEDDQKLADLYKAEQAKAKRKAAKVTKEEAEALVEASKSSLSDVPIHMGGSGAAPDDKALAPVSDLTENDLKALAMEIARADSSARTTILEILGEHGAKTITQLDPKNYRAVHGRFLSLAHDIAQDGEEI